jgi:hypothetical protein
VPDVLEDCVERDPDPSNLCLKRDEPGSLDVEMEFLGVKNSFDLMEWTAWGEAHKFHPLIELGSFGKPLFDL